MRIELTSSAWKAEVIAIIRHALVFYSLNQFARPIKVGAQRPTKIPNLSAWAGSVSPVSDHTAIDPATEPSEDQKHTLASLLLSIIFSFRKHFLWVAWDSNPEPAD